MKKKLAWMFIMVLSIDWPHKIKDLTKCWPVRFFLVMSPRKCQVTSTSALTKKVTYKRKQAKKIVRAREFVYANERARRKKIKKKGPMTNLP